MGWKKKRVGLEKEMGWEDGMKEEERWDEGGEKMG